MPTTSKTIPPFQCVLLIAWPCGYFCVEMGMVTNQPRIVPITDYSKVQLPDSFWFLDWLGRHVGGSAHVLLSAQRLYSNWRYVIRCGGCRRGAPLTLRLLQFPSRFAHSNWQLVICRQLYRTTNAVAGLGIRLRPANDLSICQPALVGHDCGLLYRIQRCALH